MALRLNLHHEIDKRKALNRRDPLKLSIIGLSVIAAGLAGYYALQFGVQASLNSDLATAQGEFDRLKGKSKMAAKFTALDDGKEPASLRGQQLSTALFTINLQMQTGEDEAPPPPPRRERKPEPKKQQEGSML